MGGWNEIKALSNDPRIRAADALAKAVDAWAEHPSTSNSERLMAARRAYAQAHLLQRTGL